MSFLPLRFIAFLVMCALALGSAAQQVFYGEYFFDNDPGIRKGKPVTFATNDSINLNLSLPLSALSNGFHQLFVRFQDINENWGIPEGRSFFINRPVTSFPPQPGKIRFAEYFIDTDPGNGKGTSIAVGADADSLNMNVNIPLTGKPPGFHQLFIRYADINRKWSIPEGRSFYISSPAVSFPPKAGQIKYAEYFIDTEPGNGMGIPIAIVSAADSVDMVVSVPLAGKPPGFHQLYVRYADVNKKWGIPEERSFYINIYTFIGNGNWTTPANWTNNLVPSNIITSTDEVLINPASGGQCTYSGNMAVLNGGKLTVQPGKILNVSGDFNNDGLLMGTGTVNFTGGGPAALRSSGTVTTLLKLTNKAMHLTGNTSTSAINLVSGSKLTLDSFNLNMGSAALTGANSTNFIITNGTGTLKRNVGSTDVMFPVGADSSSSTLVTISNAGASDTFGVRVERGAQTTGRATIDAPITSGAVNSTWIINKFTTVGSNVNLTLQWNLADEQSGFDRTKSYISHYQVCPPPINCSNGFYDAVSPTAASGPPAGPFTLTRNNITSFNTPTFIVSSLPVIYSFIGTGDWNNPLNWTNERVPPRINSETIISDGMEVIINPPAGVCNYIGKITLQPGGKLTVETGKILNIKPN